MSILAIIVIIAVAGFHLYIAWFEMFSWLKTGPKVFSHMPKELFEPTKNMAANQGLYNAFLSFGLIWSLFITDPQWQANIATCFLMFIAIAGLFGAYTASVKALLTQSVPAFIGLALIHLL